MPLRVAETVPTFPSEITDRFAVFYSSVVDGQLWCSDCIAVDSVIQDAFLAQDSPTALIIYVGDKPSWKNPTNIFRSGPWNISTVPTVIKLQEHSEVARLEGDAILDRDGLALFIKIGDDGH